MAYNVQSGGLKTTGTTDPDLFVLQRSAVQASSIEGLAGADTVQINNGAPSATAVLVDVAGGADILQLSGGTYTVSTVVAGAGGDQIIISTGASFTNTTINGGDGNDTVTFGSGSTTVFESSRLVLGGGVDTVNFAGNAGLDNTFIGAGAGADNITISASGLNLAEILGGGGADTISVVGTIDGQGFEINGDTTANGGGNDSITYVGQLSGSTIKGKGGADTITVLGIAATGSEVLGNAGGDVINIGTGAFAGASHLVGGGSGNDQITMLSGSYVIPETNSIQGGGGADTIQIGVTDATVAISGMIYGGLGADSINLVSTGLSFDGGAIAFNSLSESTLEKMDFLAFGSGESVTTTTLQADLSAITTNLTTGFAGGVGFANTVDDGLVASGDFSDQGTTAATVTARATLLDAQSQNLGEVFLFEDGANNEYLFVQGGSSGTSDDLVVALGSNLNISGGAPSMTFASGKITFG
jgi:hypothetical protein